MKTREEVIATLRQCRPVPVTTIEEPSVAPDVMQDE